MSWTERAQAWRQRIASETDTPSVLPVAASASNDDTQVFSGVLGVPTPRLSEKRDPSRAGAGVYRVLHGEGLSAHLEGGELIVLPESALDDALRELVRFHREALVRFLMAAERRTADLLAAAMRACDHHHDSPAAREQMRADCLETPPHLQLDLLEHLRESYPEPDPGGG